jgi:hypothetical protein
MNKVGKISFSGPALTCVGIVLCAGAVWGVVFCYLPWLFGYADTGADGYEHVRSEAILDDQGNIVAIGFDGVRTLVNERYTYKHRLDLISWVLTTDDAEDDAQRLRWIAMVTRGECD